MNSLKRSLNVAFFAATILLTGCAASVESSSFSTPSAKFKGEGAGKLALTIKGSGVAEKSEDWQLLRAEWRTAMTASTKNSGLGFSYHESPPKVGSDRATSVVIYVSDYRYISPGARYGLGVMTGNAYIDAEATYSDLKSGKPLGTKKYSTSSTAWQGVFSAMTEKQVQAICDQIVKDATEK